ncbi:Sir2 family NAD+-dependent deacetylase [Glaciecola sp. 1036]|uniref:Sir2 family NAD+-dependent deacetylase n=1 Tax=Alteromonadaceae TaxID=72275 RepID=UPI003D027980
MQIVILTGAGISAESGIKTFRDNNGLWENHSIEEVATPEGFYLNPELVYRFYNQRRQQLLQANILPNAAHIALAKLEAKWPHQVTLITQNVDNLHERAGSKEVIHMHGELMSAKCPVSNQSETAKMDFSHEYQCECCSPSQSMRPDIVWFGEIPYSMDVIETRLTQADLFISIGTSGNVYPAAGFVQLANEVGAKTVELNMEPSVGNSLFEEKVYGKASEIVPAFVDKLLHCD